MSFAGRASLLGLVLSSSLLLLLTGCPNGAGITCPPGQSVCNGKCLDVTSDPANCGGCNLACPGTLVCIRGSCGCPTNLSSCADTCVDENVDGNNCGGCGTACLAGQVCSSGMCELTCGPNLQQCGSSCIDTQNDPSNCGMCQHVCDVNNICCGGNCVQNDTRDHCGSCAPCTSIQFCIDAGGDMGLICSAG